jgi:geranylgeranyl diphosphate synthase, type I
MAPPALSDMCDVRTRVHKALTEFLSLQEPRMNAVSTDLAPLLDCVIELLSAGKRLRPLFCYWGWRAVGGSDTEGIIQAAASLELLHACALIHDDVMDRSDTRRGQPSVHRRFAVRHSQYSWSGSADDFGAGAAILLGDLCLSWSDELLSTATTSVSARQPALAMFAQMRTELMCGQYLDLLEQARGGGSVDRALQVIRYKSARYTVERPLHLGGLLAGASPEALAQFSDYGLPLGTAFQLRDDMLGVFGDPAETGKPAGDDLREGKRTLMVEIAMERATPLQRDALTATLGRRDLTAGDLFALQEILIDTGAVAEIERKITELTADALMAITSGTLEPEAQRILGGLAREATERRL